MTQFFIIAALMIVFALLFVLPTLLRASTSTGVPSADAVNLQVLEDQLHELDSDRQAGTLDAKSFDSATQELQKRLPLQQSENPAGGVLDRKNNGLAAMLSIVVLVLAVGLYQLLGTPAALDPAKLAVQTEEVSQQQILGMVQKLADKLKQQPGDAQGWNMLARSYFELRRFQDASDAYAHLIQLVPDSADYLASYALTMALAHNKNLQGEPDALLQRALKLDAKNIRALSLSGSAAFDRHDFTAAINYWNQVLVLVAPNSDIARSTQNGINEAQAMLKNSEPDTIVKIPEPGR